MWPGTDWARVAGLSVAGLVLALMLGSLAAVLTAAGGVGRLGPSDWAALRFTLIQAILSALLSVALAIPVARALARRRFRGRAALITLLGAPFLLPTIVAVLGLIAIFGRAGWINTALGWAGLPPVQIYGLQGVVLAHVFFNLPLAVRMILQGFQAIPSERFRLAQSLGFRPGDVWRHLERPVLREVLPGATLAVFLICLTSFAVALIMGGGPRATTLELAIWQSIRFDFDLGRAAVLAAAQFVLCAAAVLAAGRVAVPAGFGAGLDRPLAVPAPQGIWRALDLLTIVAAALFLLTPLAAVAGAGLAGLVDLPAPVWHAAARSVAVALTATALAIGAALALGAVAVRGGLSGRAAEIAGMLPLAASGLVLGTGLFLLTFPIVAPSRIALPVTALVNAALALPFALRILLPPLREIHATQHRLAESLGIHGLGRLRLVTLPRLRRPLGFAAGVVAALAMGDLGVIALFAAEGTETLPLQVWRLMGAYRTQSAEAAALLLVALGFMMFAGFDSWGRRCAAT
ncbi:MAG: thiamine/thiamine pyrophosphate ABC transporter permease ThiP [Gemmobacter sp.]